MLLYVLWITLWRKKDSMHQGDTSNIFNFGYLRVLSDLHRTLVQPTWGQYQATVSLTLSQRYIFIKGSWSVPYLKSQGRADDERALWELQPEGPGSSTTGIASVLYPMVNSQRVMGRGQTVTKRGARWSRPGGAKGRGRTVTKRDARSCQAWWY